jgi:hypothetical protein
MQCWLLTGGKYKWEWVIRKGSRRNSLWFHTERQVMGISYDDYRNRERGKVKLHRK